MTPPRGPVVIDLDERPRPGAAPDLGPADAPPILDAPVPPGRAMRAAIRLGAGRGSRFTRLFWGALAALLALMLSLAAWDYVTGLLARIPVLGALAAGLAGLVLLAALALGLRELAAMARLARLDDIRSAAEAALAAGDPVATGRAIAGLAALYAGRPELARARSRLAQRIAEGTEPAALAAMAEAELLAPLDEAARREVEAAARQVAAVTAFVPLALADVAAALLANLRMIRRIAEIYGGRAGLLGGWRLTRTVLTHLVATGAVAVSDDLVGSLAGGGMLSKLSRRFGEGVVNGALTARVGVAALEVCRPMPFVTRPAPRVAQILRRALTGLFDGD